MGELRRRYGFWGAVGALRLRDLVTSEFVVGPILGGGLVWLMLSRGSLANRTDLAGDYIQLAGALLGVVFGGFALVIAFLSDDYIHELDQTGEGIVAFLRPFMVATGLQVGVVAGVVLYRGAAALVPNAVEKTAFGVLTILFMVALLDLVALARSVLLHGVARARQTRSTR